MADKIQGLTAVPWDGGGIDWEAFDYGFLTMISEVKLQSAAALAKQDIAMEELLEARVFNGRSELHIWREARELTGSMITVSDDADTIPFSFAVSSALAGAKFAGGRKILGVDEDGQAYVAYTKLDFVRE